jgi:plasmid stabilization system protein ParE
VKRKVQWSQDALDDLKSQIEYIATRNPAAARRVAALIRSVGIELGSMSTGRHGRVSGTFEKSVRGLPYIIAYAISPGHEGEITILRVIHGARDWPEENWPID